MDKMKYATDAYGNYETYTFEEFIAEGCPADIPIGFFKIPTDGFKYD